jgi:hypothetical protein
MEVASVSRTCALLLVALLVATWADPVPAREPDAEPQLAHITDVQQLSLADLLDTRVDLASREPQTTRGQ